eukprot:SAG31_NODE_3923_length_3749_cov_2.030685_3_plen_237_part_00
MSFAFCTILCLPDVCMQAISGKVRVFCFDKTGTLTKQGLDFLGVLPFFPMEKKSDDSDPIVPVARLKTLPSEVMHGLATCHAVSRYGQNLVGNQVEVKMFEATGWALIEEKGKQPAVCDTGGDEPNNLIVEKRFEFDHSRMSMSVLVRNTNGDVLCYCKGASERVKGFCVAKSVPEQFDEISAAQATAGCYVLGLAFKNLGQRHACLLHLSFMVVSVTPIWNSCASGRSIVIRRGC